MEVRVFHGNRQAETSPADGARPRRVATPEAMEDLPGLTGFEAHAVITNRDCHGGLVAFDQDVDRMALAVLDCVDQEVAQDSLNPARPRPCRPWREP